MQPDSPTQDELSTLKARADQLGISYHPSIGLAKLREKVNAAIEGTQVEPDEQEDAPVQAKSAAARQETEAEIRTRMRQEQLALVRIRLTCMNPQKSEWEGEVFTVGNALVGSITKYVPFNAEDGWHVPQILLDTLQDRHCQIFTSVKAKNGVDVRQGKLIKEFAIEILPPLTQRELKDLAQRQAMASGSSIE